jgi:hypothetical protein
VVAATATPLSSQLTRHGSWFGFDEKKLVAESRVFAETDEVTTHTAKKTMKIRILVSVT